MKRLLFITSLLSACGGQPVPLASVNATDTARNPSEVAICHAINGGSNSAVAKLFRGEDRTKLVAQITFPPNAEHPLPVTTTFASCEGGNFDTLSGRIEGLTCHDPEAQSPLDPRFSIKQYGAMIIGTYYWGAPLVPINTGYDCVAEDLDAEDLAIDKTTANDSGLHGFDATFSNRPASFVLSQHWDPDFFTFKISGLHFPDWDILGYEGHENQSNAAIEIFSRGSESCQYAPTEHAIVSCLVKNSSESEVTVRSGFGVDKSKLLEIRFSTIKVSEKTLVGGEYGFEVSETISYSAVLELKTTSGKIIGRINELFGSTSLR